jgi:hypothetical protein
MSVVRIILYKARSDINQHVISASTTATQNATRIFIKQPVYQMTARARAAATPPAAQRAFPVIIGIAALPVPVWLVAAALPEDSAVLVPVAVLAAVFPEVEAEVVREPVEAAVEAEAEAPVVAEAPVSVAVTVTAIKAPPGIEEIGIALDQVVLIPLSFMLAEQVALEESYLQFSEMVLR